VLSELGAGSTIADRYALGEVIGRGGMGEVRDGQDLRLGRDVAIKLLNAEVAARPNARERFEAEARAAARLSHPNIVVVYDSGEHGGVPFLVMERLPGRTLADELAEVPLSPERVRRVGAGILAALDAAHARGVVHRDIKPGNVLLCPDGGAKVADFGIAKAVDDVDLTTTGMLLGTPAYLAPEQVAGEPATPATDIYSVGVLLYEALTGSKPFDAASPLALANLVQNGTPAPISQLRPDAPPELVAAITKAMEKDPRRRFSSAGEMAAALAALGSADVTTERVASTIPFDTTTRRAAGRTRETGVPAAGLRSLAHGPRRQLAVLAAIFAAVLVLAVVFTARDTSSSGDRPDPSTPATATAPDGSLNPELDRALQRLEEVTRP
jgi:serine/threonine protein kinase